MVGKECFAYQPPLLLGDICATRQPFDGFGLVKSEKFPAGNLLRVRAPSTGLECNLCPGGGLIDGSLEHRERRRCSS